MFANKKLAILVVLVMIAPIVLAACGATPEPEVIVETVVVEQTKIVTEKGEEVTIVETVEVEVTVPPPPTAEPTPVPEAVAGPYRIALFEDPITLNYWSYLGPDSSVWTQYVLSGHAAALFTLSDVTFQWGPSLAAEPNPEIVDNGDGTYSIEVPMVQDAVWSDGEPITANDFVFTFNACKDLQLTHNWPNQCAPNGVDVAAEAVDDYTVKVTFLDAEPGLGTWQMGVALAPILPEHYWGEKVAAAYDMITGAAEPDVDRPEDCEAEDLSDDDKAACDAWAAYDETVANGRNTLYTADALGAPTAGGYISDKLELGAFAQRTANADYYFKDAEVVEYDDGTWMLVHPNGTTYQLYGDAAGEETLRFTSGPYAPNVVFSIYGSQDAAFLALADGEVDYVLNPLGLAKGFSSRRKRVRASRPTPTPTMACTTWPSTCASTPCPSTSSARPLTSSSTRTLWSTTSSVASSSPCTRPCRPATAPGSTRRPRPTPIAAGAARSAWTRLCVC